MKFSLVFVFLSTLVFLSNSFKIAYDNGNNVLRLESNVLHNGKPIKEPKADEAIDAISKLGFKVVDVQDGKPSEKKESISVLKAKHPKDSSQIEIKPRDKIENVFRKVFSPSDKVRNLNYKKSPYPDQYAKPNEPKVAYHRFQLDHAKYGSFDIYITNVNENVNQNNASSTTY